MIVFTSYVSPHVNRLIAKTIGALARRGLPAVTVAWQPAALAELRSFGHEGIHLSPEADVAFSADLAVEQYCASLRQAGRWPPFRGFEVPRLIKAEMGPRGGTDEADWRETKRLVREALRALGHAEMVFDCLQPTLLVVWNGLRGVPMAWRAVAEARRVPVRFIERGLLPATVHYDDVGVNAGAAIASCGELRCHDDSALAWARAVAKKYRDSEASGLSQPDAIDDGVLRARYGLVGAGKIALFAGQLQQDTNFTAYAPNFKEPTEIYAWLARAYAAVSDQATLVVKRHPYDRTDLGRQIEGLLPGARYVSDGNVRQWLRLCHHVVTVNSTTGLEAAVLGRPVILLGDAAYGGCGTASKGLTRDVASAEDLTLAVRQVLASPLFDPSRAERAELFLACLRERGEILDSQLPDEPERWAERLEQLAPSPGGPPRPARVARWLGDCLEQQRRLRAEIDRLLDQVTQHRSLLDRLRAHANAPSIRLAQRFSWVRGLRSAASIAELIEQAHRREEAECDS